MHSIKGVGEHTRGAGVGLLLLGKAQHVAPVWLLLLAGGERWAFLCEADAQGVKTGHGGCRRMVVRLFAWFHDVYSNALLCCCKDTGWGGGALLLHRASAKPTTLALVGCFNCMLGDGW